MFASLKQASNSCHASFYLIYYDLLNINIPLGGAKVNINALIIEKFFYRLAKTVRSSIYAFRNAQEENILVNGSIKKFFNYARSRMHPSYRMGPLKRPDGKTAINDTERADLFNNFFHSIFVPDDGNTPSFRPRTDKAMPTSIFSVTDIRKSLTASSTSISCGPDGIPLYF